MKMYNDENLNPELYKNPLPIEYFNNSIFISGDVILIRPVLLALYKNIQMLSHYSLNKNFKTLFDFDNRIRFVGVDFNSKEGKTLNLINR